MRSRPVLNPRFKPEEIETQSLIYPYKCPICGARARTLEELDDHMRFMHGVPALVEPEEAIHRNAYELIEDLIR